MKMPSTETLPYFEAGPAMPESGVAEVKPPVVVPANTADVVTVAVPQAQAQTNWPLLIGIGVALYFLMKD